MRFSSAFWEEVSLLGMEKGGDTYVGVVFLKELDDTDIVFECYSMRLGEGFQFWHVCFGGGYGSENVFRKADRIELEVGLEEEICNVVESPFA